MLNYIVIMMLALMMVAGLTAVKTGRDAIWIARNRNLRMDAFFLAEGALAREAQEIAAGHYPVADSRMSGVLATESSPELPPPAPHTAGGKPYGFTIEYLGCFAPADATSAVHFSRYDYEVTVQRGAACIRARYGLLGPKQPCVFE